MIDFMMSASTPSIFTVSSTASLKLEKHPTIFILILRTFEHFAN